MPCAGASAPSCSTPPALMSGSAAGAGPPALAAALWPPPVRLGPLRTKRCRCVPCAARGSDEERTLRKECAHEGSPLHAPPTARRGEPCVRPSSSVCLPVLPLPKHRRKIGRALLARKYLVYILVLKPKMQHLAWIMLSRQVQAAWELQAPARRIEPCADGHAGYAPRRRHLRLCAYLPADPEPR